MQIWETQPLDLMFFNHRLLADKTLHPVCQLFDAVTNKLQTVAKASHHVGLLATLQSRSL